VTATALENIACGIADTDPSKILSQVETFDFPNGEPVGLEMIAEDFGAFIIINIKTCGRYKLRLDWPNACSEIRISYSDQPIARDERR
jgi:hypothetical protein